MSDLTFDDSTDKRLVPKTPTYQNTRIDIRNINKYKFVTEAFEGSGGFCDGSYLLPHAREAWYEERQAMSFYRNYIKPVGESIVYPAINNITRTSTSDIYNQFILDVDYKGNDINTHVMDVMLHSRLHGNVFVVMDNFANQPLDLSSAIEQRNIPYVYIQPAYTVDTYEADDFGNLVTITFYSYVKIDGKTYKMTYKWDDNQLVITKYDGEKAIEVKPFPHNFGVLPVIQVNSTIQKEVMPFPPFYDIARLQYALYNKDSEVRDQERAQAFSILYVQTDTPQNGIALGPHNAIIIPANDKITMPPGYISPDSNILTILSNNSRVLIESIYEAAKDRGAVGVSEAKSGVAEAYRFIGTNNELQHTAAIAADYETKLVDMLSKISNTDITVEIRYPREFNPAINRSSIDDTLKLLNLDISDELKHEIKKALLSDVLSHLDKEKLEQLLAYSHKPNESTEVQALEAE